MKKITGKDIAISGISAGLAVVSILLSIFLSTLTLTFYVISSLCIALPLIKNNLLSSILSYIAASLVGFFIASIHILPFVFFFGLYAIVEWVLDFKFYNIEKIKKWIKICVIIVVKIIFFIGMFFACFYLMKIVVDDIAILGINFTFLTFFISSFIVFVLYDILYRETYKLMQKMLINKLK